jgi:hypothetical protein
VDNPSLSKGITNLNRFKFNLRVDPKKFSCEPQNPWIQVPVATRCNYGPTCQISSNSEASKSLEFKSTQIWLKLLLWFLIQILVQILKNSNEEISSLLNHLYGNILFGKFGAREGSFLIESIWIGLKIIQINQSWHCYSGPAHWSAPVPLQRAALALCRCCPLPLSRHSCCVRPSMSSPTPTPLYKNRSRLHFFVFGQQELESPFFSPLPTVTPMNNLRPSINPFGPATTSVDRPRRFPMQVTPSQLTGRLPRRRFGRHLWPPVVSNWAAWPAKWPRRASPMLSVPPAQPLAVGRSRPAGLPSRCGAHSRPGRWAGDEAARSGPGRPHRPLHNRLAGQIRPIGRGGFDLIFEFFSILEFTLNFKNSLQFVEILENFKLNFVGILVSRSTQNT